jgi:hypothetical protein
LPHFKAHLLTIGYCLQNALSLHILVLKNGGTGGMWRAISKDVIEIRKKKKRFTETMKSPSSWNLKHTTSQLPFFELQFIEIE